jgi:hypothetical protein
MRTLFVLCVLLCSQLRLRYLCRVNHVWAFLVPLRGRILNAWWARLVERRFGRLVRIIRFFVARIPLVGTHSHPIIPTPTISSSVPRAELAPRDKCG